MGLQRLAEDGDAGAKLALGLLLNAGIGQEMNQSLAVQNFRKAAMAGDAVAMNCLAGAIEEGNRAPVRKVDVLTPKKAARNAGQCAVEAVDSTAAEWYRKAAEAGVAQAQSNYALTLMQGKGAVKDEKAWRLCAEIKTP